MSLVLKTSRLVLMPILEGEVNRLHSIVIDPYVRKYLCDDKIFSWQQTEEMLKENQKRFSEEKFGLWFIKTKNEREIIGFVGLWYFFAEDQPQLVYALLPKATKQGYGTEAANKILEYSFNELGYDYLIAVCDRQNLESQKVATRLGMKQVEERIINNNLTLFFKIDRIEIKNTMPT